ncbi:MAG: anaerobic ribonucleoside-triphosphate reductase activating protein [Cellulosilyticaceae bacterium]
MIKINYAQIRKYDVANGPGIRVSIFFSGCTHKCKGCFNQEYQDFNYGTPFTDETKAELFEYLSDENVAGLSILGGEPLQQDLDILIILLREIRDKFPSKTIWMWTGYLLDELFKHEKKMEVVRLCDVIVDGRYMENERDLKLKFRGSRNQRIIDVKASLDSGSVIEY